MSTEILELLSGLVAVGTAAPEVPRRQPQHKDMFKLRFVSNTHDRGEPGRAARHWCSSHSPASAGADTRTRVSAQEPPSTGLGTHHAAVEPSALLPLLLLARLFEDTTLPCLASHRIKAVPIPKTIWSRCFVCSGWRPRTQAPVVSLSPSQTHICQHQHRVHQPQYQHQAWFTAKVPLWPRRAQTCHWHHRFKVSKLLTRNQST